MHEANMKELLSSVIETERAVQLNEYDLYELKNQVNTRLEERNYE